MPEPTHATTSGNNARARWRDAVYDDARLRTNDVIVALVFADFWRKDSDHIWVTVEVAMRMTRLSRASVFKSIARLRELGYLHEAVPARHNRAPRFVPKVPRGIPSTRPADREPTARARTKQSVWQTDESVSCTDWSARKTRDVTEDAKETSYGSSDQDSASAPGPAHVTAGGRPRTRAEREDLEVLAQHMANYPAESVRTVWTLLRAGSCRDGSQADRPGAFAKQMHARATADPDISQWQGMFHRLFETCDQEPAPHPVVDLARATLSGETTAA